MNAHRRASLVVPILLLLVATQAQGQHPGPRQTYDCWGCIYQEGGGFMQGWPCMCGMVHGGSCCREWLEGEQYVCETEGTCDPDFSAGPDAALVSEGGTVELANPVAPGIAESRTCSTQRVFYLDGNGLVLGGTAKPAPSHETRLKPTER
jgi:hypothetical protein